MHSKIEPTLHVAERRRTARVRPTREIVPSQTSKGGGMDWDRIKGRWKQVSGQAQQQWGKLTDDELARVDGRRDEFEGLIQERYGKSKDDVRREVGDWLNRI
jgi:uncharacterized protein YjbJ (UPF0337 family)